MHDPSNDPYSAPKAPLEMSPAEPVQFEQAGRLLRLVGSFIDGMLLLVILLPAMWFGGYFAGFMQGQRPVWTMQVLWAGIGFGVFVLVQGVPLAQSGQTWAKKWLGMRIVDMQGHKPEFGRLLALRYLTTQAIAQVPCVGPLYALVDALMIFGDDHRCLHDKIAGTQVIVTPLPVPSYGTDEAPVVQDQTPDR